MCRPSLCFINNNNVHTLHYMFAIRQTDSCSLTQFIVLLTGSQAQINRLMFSSKLILIKTPSRQRKKRASPRSLTFAYAEYCWGLGFCFYIYLLLLLLSCSGLTRWMQLLWAPNSPMLFRASQCLVPFSVTKKFNIGMYLYTHMDIHILQFIFAYIYVFYLLCFSVETNKKLLLSAEGPPSWSFPLFIHCNMPLILLKFYIST